MTKNPVTQEGEFFSFKCPHCDICIMVHTQKTACKIFRHATYFTILPNLPPINGRPQYAPTQQINPHTPKEICDKLVSEGRVLGCAKPFRFVYSPHGNYVEKCDYI